MFKRIKCCYNMFYTPLLVLVELLCFTLQKGSPSCLCDDHFCANIMEAFPQISALQLHLDLLHRD